MPCCTVLFAALRAEAVAGNIAAARLLLDRLAPASPEASRGRSLEELIEESYLSPEERTDRVRAMLADAACRDELDRQRPVLNVVTGGSALPTPSGSGRDD